MTLAYDGGGFRGFAAQSGQPHVPTVAAALGGAIERVLGIPVVLTAAGRTDAGVHAWGQVVSFDADPALVRQGRLVPDRLARSLNTMLGPEIVVRGAVLAEPGFDARRSALARRYRYSVLNRCVADPFLASTTWHVDTPLNLGAMRLACDPVIGEHDFSSFCRAPRGLPGASLVRLVSDARWIDMGDGLFRFDVEARAFCHQMVRAMVGAMVAVGLGRRRAGEMAGILAQRSRSATPDLAPARGLCLWEVVYP